MEPVALEGSLEVGIAVEPIEIVNGRARPSTVIEAAIETEDLEAEAAELPMIPAQFAPHRHVKASNPRRLDQEQPVTVLALQTMLLTRSSACRKKSRSSGRQHRRPHHRHWHSHIQLGMVGTVGTASTTQLFYRLALP